MNIQPQTTAAIFPEKFDVPGLPVISKTALWIALAAIIALGFGLRTYQLGRESLGEDEFNKLKTVEEYRTNGLTGRNGEHPFLMKGLQTASIVASEKWNAIAGSSATISEEAALRFPTALFGAFTSLLLFLVVSQLFGTWPGLITAILWAVDPSAIGFDRVAKEDSFLLFFFLLANVFWIRSQTGAERGEGGWIKYVYIAAFFFGSMVASKYLPHLLAISLGYNVALAFPGHKWQLKPKRWLIFFAVMGIGFLVCNPTILLPQTWREMLTFGTENRIGHDSYEFLGTLYPNRMTAWFSGVPWYFYYVFILLKTPVVTLLLFLVGLPLIFRKSIGDGRYFLLLWAFMWFLPFTVLGGKFTRYFAVAEPLVLIVAAVGLTGMASWIAVTLGGQSGKLAAFALVLIALGSSLRSSVIAAPHYRLHLNALGSGGEGTVFPHDEFYYASTFEIAKQIAAAAGPNAAVANETPALFEHYLRKAGRSDLRSISLSDDIAVRSLTAGDFVIAARGRRYKSNSGYLEALKEISPMSITHIGDIESARIYRLIELNAEFLNSLAEAQIANRSQ